MLKQQHRISDVCGSGYMFIDELPKEHVLYNKRFTLKYFNPYIGDINIEEYDTGLENVAMPLDIAFQRAILEADACLVNMIRNIFAVFKEGLRFAVFDSHSRNSEGAWSVNGTSLVAYYASLHMMFMHISTSNL